MSKARRGPSGPSGKRAYAIGDIHGRLDLMIALLEQIAEDDRRRGRAETFLIFLGDLVDRGPDSAGVIHQLLTQPPPFRTAHLMGNHEEMFLRVLEGEDEIIPAWLTYGGYECAESYGVSRGWTLNVSPGEIGQRLRKAVPRTHRKFLEEMVDSFGFGDYLFVHAGIRPGVPFEEQSSRDLRWIREGFVDDATDHQAMIVHGHTIVESVQQLPNRIAIDTGAYRSGLLTAIGLEGDERWFLEARDGAQAPS